MLRVSKHTDYGMLLLTAMVSGGDSANYSARQLADMTHLPYPMVGKILKALAREGILVSQRGPKGGYGLVRRPEEITLVDIVSAMEGPIAVTECIGSPGDCEHETSCPVQVNWLHINYMIKQALQEITLWDMTQPLHELLPLVADRGRSAAGPAEEA